MIRRLGLGQGYIVIIAGHGQRGARMQRAAASGGHAVVIKRQLAHSEGAAIIGQAAAPAQGGRGQQIKPRRRR